MFKNYEMQKHFEREEKLKYMTDEEKRKFLLQEEEMKKQEQEAKKRVIDSSFIFWFEVMTAFSYKMRLFLLHFRRYFLLMAKLAALKVYNVYG